MTDSRRTRRAGRPDRCSDHRRPHWLHPALLSAADEVVRHHKLSDTGWHALRQNCNDDEALELSMFVGHCVMVAMIINTEPAFAVTAPSA